MIIPGQVLKVNATFDEAGVYNIICHEYCGLAHNQMFGRVKVGGEG
jgi:cytochrome c oxidase subunit 2